jgi:hypothetical protein
MRWRQISSRLKGRSKIKWEDDVMQDIQTVNIKNWRRIAMNRSRWNKTVEQAMTHHGL